MVKLGVNIDHVATVRQARRGTEPSVIVAAQEALAGGADGITIHLREDRRHIQDADVAELKAFVPRLNLEMAIAPEMIAIAQKVQPQYACLVPEKREEITTEGGLDVVTFFESVREAVRKLHSAGMSVSLFVDPDERQIERSRDTGATHIELHTGQYANAHGDARQAALVALQTAALHAQHLGLTVNAGHGLNYDNVQDVARIPGLYELNIGHSIVSRALFVGLRQAVSEMADLVRNGDI
jgi:pyridoxine 5-phosphate synthase